MYCHVDFSVSATGWPVMEKLSICSHFLKDVLFCFFSILAGFFFKEMYLDDSPLQDVVLRERVCCLSVKRSRNAFYIFIPIFTVLLILPILYVITTPVIKPWGFHRAPSVCWCSGVKKKKVCIYEINTTSDDWFCFTVIIITANLLIIHHQQ